MDIKYVYTTHDETNFRCSSTESALTLAQTQLLLDDIIHMVM